MIRFRTVWMIAALLVLSGCGAPKSAQPAPGSPAKSETKSGEAKTESGHAHEHHAPHKGALVVLGEEFAHVEMVLDEAAGKLTAYVLDGEAENPVRLKQPELVIKATLPGKDGAKGEVLTLALKAQASALTGETIGDASEFSVQDDKLKGIKSFDGELTAIDARGQAFKNVAFNFPKGNEVQDKH